MTMWQHIGDVQSWDVPEGPSLSSGRLFGLTARDGGIVISNVDSVFIPREFSYRLADGPGPNLFIIRRSLAQRCLQASSWFALRVAGCAAPLRSMIGAALQFLAGLSRKQLSRVRRYSEGLHRRLVWPRQSIPSRSASRSSLSCQSSCSDSVGLVRAANGDPVPDGRQGSSGATDQGGEP